MIPAIAMDVLPAIVIKLPVPPRLNFKVVPAAPPPRRIKPFLSVMVALKRKIPEGK
ncbi:MAG: hypothetical protein ABI707_04800 [Ferruginibacter sp.]